MLTKSSLEDLYVDQRLSMMQISRQLHCSVHTVVYWMTVHGITRRSRSDAVYQRNHPNGDPFSVIPITTLEQAELWGMGIGLYWGEGTKANKHAVRLGNSDPELLNMFIRFLTELFCVKRNDLRFGLQIFTDINPTVALNYWTNKLHVEGSQFYKATVTISGSIGTYRQKSEYGVVTVHYNNKKLRDIIVGMLPR